MLDCPRMASVPEINTDLLPLLQLQEVDSSKAPEGGGSPGVLPTAYNPPVGVDADTVIIPSPYTDSCHEYSHGPLTFYNPSALSYARPPVTDSPSSLCPPVSPSLFWPSPSHPNVSSLTLHCPQPLVYNEPSPHPPWVEAKPHSITHNSSNKLLGKRLDEGVEGANSSSSSALGKTDMHFCAVCHDYASGYHYGVWSCEGCKAFFKRSIQGHNDYICPATNQCTIDKNRRKSCQACRLRKCYEVGMMKCGVRRERCSYRGARHRRGGLQPRDPTGSRGLVRVGLGSRSQRHLHLETPLLPLPALHLPDHVHHSAMTPEQFVSRIIEAEPPAIYLMKDTKKPFTQASIMMSLTSLAGKELVLMINWAKKIPGFADLIIADQINLLKCCWLEVLMLGLMWRSVDHPGKLIFSPDFKLNREEGHCVEGIVEIFDMLLAATSRFRELKLQREEYVCLKVMILLNSKICTSSAETAGEEESSKRLQGLLDMVVGALVWASSKLGLSSQQQSLRLGHLTMLLSHIRHASNKGMGHLYFMKEKKVVLICDLLMEMLDANMSPSWSSGSSGGSSGGSSSGHHTSSSSPSSEGYPDQHPHASHVQTSTNQTPTPPHETPILGTHLQAQHTQPPPPSQNLELVHMPVESNGYVHAEQWPADTGDVGPTVESLNYCITDQIG